MKEGWGKTTIEHVAKVINGGTPKTKTPEYWGGSILWITPAEMSNLSTPYLADSRRTLTEEGLKGSSAALVPPKSVILSTRAPIGHLIINTKPMAFNQGCRGIIPNHELNYKYLYYFLLSSVSLLNDLGSGTTFKELSASKLKKVKIPLPPLSEQKRIVTILDDAFASIDAAIANTEKNLANARELFDSYLDSVFSQRGDGWVEKPLIHFVDSVSTGPFGSLLHKSDYVSVGVPLVNPVNIVGEEVIPDEKKMISDEKKETLQSYILKKGDIVIARRGEIGRCAVITDRQKGWVCGTGCFFIRPGGEINPHLLAHLLRSFSYRTQLERLSSGATMLNLSNSALKNLKIVIPSMSEQNKIADQIMEFKDQFQEVQSIYQQKLIALAELKQSLLQKAFSGELTADKADSKDIMDETQNMETALT